MGRPDCAEELAFVARETGAEVIQVTPRGWAREPVLVLLGAISVLDYELFGLVRPAASSTQRRRLLEERRFFVVAYVSTIPRSRCVSPGILRPRIRHRQHVPHLTPRWVLRAQGHPASTLDSRVSWLNSGNQR
jgi:hypothetical protein